MVAVIVQNLEQQQQTPSLLNTATPIRSSLCDGPQQRTTLPQASGGQHCTALQHAGCVTHLLSCGRVTVTQRDSVTATEECPRPAPQHFSRQNLGLVTVTSSRQQRHVNIVTRLQLIIVSTRGSSLVTS